MGQMLALRSAKVVSLPTIVSHGISRASSDDYDWSDVHLAPFEIYGLLAFRAPDKSPHVNLSRRSLQLQRTNAEFNWQRGYNQAVENFSFGVLHFYASLLELPSSAPFLFRPAKYRNVSIVQAFGQDCLCSMPRAGGRIPLASLADWWTDNVR